MPSTDQARPLFKAIDQALEKVFETLSMPGIKVATYGVPTAASSSTDRLSNSERLTEAVWIMGVIDTTLNAVERAYVTAAYDGRGQERNAALDTLMHAHAALSKNPELIREVFVREFDFGETYSRSLRNIAKQFGISHHTVDRLAKRVQAEVERINRSVEAKLRPRFEERNWLRGLEKLAA